MDETTIGLIYPILKCWMKLGQQKVLPMMTGKRSYQYLAGVFNWHTEEIHCQPLEAMNSEAVIGYFEWLFTEIYPTQTVILVLDNASFHHSYAVQAALSLFEDRVLVLWLPPYSPDMNPIERFWKHLKANACANKLYQSLEQLVTGVFDLIACQNQTGHELRLSFCKDF
jgi:transposase